jgi:hypothetical protein
VVPSDLERRIRDLEHAPPVAARHQTGFPAKITSEFDADTGYEWERMTLAEGEVQDANNPLTGNRAFDLGGSTEIPEGTVVWLEPDAASQGYLITDSASGDDDTDKLVTGVCPVIAECDTITAAAYTMTQDDTIIQIDPTSNNITVTLPAWRAGDFYIFKRITGGVNTVTIDGAGGDTIDGAATFTLTDQWASKTIHAGCSSGTWIITAEVGT